MQNLLSDQKVRLNMLGKWKIWVNKNKSWCANAKRLQHLVFRGGLPSTYTAAFAKRLTNVCAIVCQTFLVKHLTTQQRCRHLPDVYYKRLSIVYFNKCLSYVYFISFLEHFLCVWQMFIFYLWLMFIFKLFRKEFSDIWLRNVIFYMLY